MWRDVRTLWHWRWRVLRRTSLAVDAMIFLGLPVGGPLALFLGWQIGRDIPRPAAAVTYVILALVFFLLQAFLLAVTLRRGAATLYQENDLDLLLAAPVRPVAVFLERLLELVLFPGLALTFPVVVFFWGVGVAWQLALWYYPALLIAGVALPCVPIALGAVLLLVLVRYLPPWRLQEVLVGVGIALLVAYQVSVSFVSPTWTQALWQAVQGWLLGEPAAGFWATSPGMWPTNWAAWAVAAAGLGRPDLAAGRLAAFGAVSLAAVGFSVLVSLRLYLSGWARVGDAPVRRRARPISVRRPSRTWVSRPVSALIRKDLTLLRRDPQRLYGLVWPVVYVVGFFFARQGERWRDVRTDTALNFGWVTFVLVLGFALAMTAWPFHVFHTEEKTLWLLRSAPISEETWLAAKFGMALVPTLLVGLAIALGFAFTHNPWAKHVAQAVGLALIQSVGVSALAVSLSPPPRGSTYEAGSNEIDRFLYIAGYLLVTDTVLLVPLRGVSSPILEAAVAAFRVAFLVTATWWIVQASFRMTVRCLRHWEVL